MIIMVDNINIINIITYKQSNNNKKDELTMGDRNIRKEVKKPKKSSTKSTTISSTPRPPVVQPELIRKEKKVK